MTDVLIIGCGYSGRRVAARHRDRGDAVTATTRRGLAPVDDVRVLALDLDAPALPALPAVERVYYTAPPPASGLTDPRLERLLAALPAPRTFVYFSTTAVYGDHDGGTVTEDTPPAPGTDRGRRRLAAETAVQEWAARHAVQAGILRIAAIYGPDRLPLQRLKDGSPVPDAGSGPGNRIHVDDLAAAAVAIGDAGSAGVWNISDGNPLTSADFTDLVADAAGLPRPRRVAADSAQLSSERRRFLSESRQVSNHKLLTLPGFRLQHPDPATAIRSLVKNSTW